LVIMDMNSQSTKAQKARLNGIDLIGPETFFVMCDLKNHTFSKHEDIKNHIINKQKAEVEKKIIAEQIKRPLRRIIL